MASQGPKDPPPAPPIVVMSLHSGYLRSKTAGAPLVFEASTEIDGVEYRAKSASGAISALCRILVDAGISDSPWQACRDGRVSLMGPSIHRMAKLAVSEGVSYGPRFVKWRPFSEADFTGDGIEKSFLEPQNIMRSI